MTCTSTTHDKEGLPAELIDDGRLNVSLDELTVEDKLVKSIELQQEILNQLVLLNARFEEMANTRITENDIGR